MGDFQEKSNSLKDCLRASSRDDIEAVYQRMKVHHSEPEIVDAVEHSPPNASLEFPSLELKRKADSILADYSLVCHKYGVDPARPTSDIVTKLLLFVESTGKWSPWSLKYILVCFPLNLFLNMFIIGQFIANYFAVV